MSRRVSVRLRGVSETCFAVKSPLGAQGRRKSR